MSLFNNLHIIQKSIISLLV